MAGIILRRILSALLTIWLTASMTFLALRLLPGNAIEAQLQGTNLPQSVVDQRLADFGLNQSLIMQYRDFMFGLLRGDLGLSLYGGQTVNEILWQRLPTTIKLAGGSIICAIIAGFTLGLATHTDIKPFAHISQILIDLSIAVPVYWTATLVLFVLSDWLGGIRNNVILPILVLGFHSAGAIARITSISIADIRNTSYIRTAYAKGLNNRRIWLIHILRNAIAPIINIIALQTGILFSGTVITETIFQQAGVGLTLINATLERNYPLVQGIVIYTTIIYIAVNTLADVITTSIDPRVRAS